MTDVLKYTDLYNTKEIREFFEYEYDTRKDSRTLRNGNFWQKEAYRIFNSLNIKKNLKEFNPVIAGTIPLGINLPNSNIYILLYCKEIKKLRSILHENYSLYTSSELDKNTKEKVHTAQFFYNGRPIKIIAQNRITALQNAFMHMIIEYYILNENDDFLTQKIISHKKQGMDTEQAFCTVLNIKGDPYKEILRYGVKKYVLPYTDNFQQQATQQQENYSQKIIQQSIPEL